MSPLHKAQVALPELNNQHNSEDILDGFDALMIKGYAKFKREHPHRKNKGGMLVAKDTATLPSLAMPMENAKPSAAPVCHRVDDKALVNRSQKSDKVEIVSQESNSRMPMRIGSARSNDATLFGTDVDKGTTDRLQENNKMEKGSAKSIVTTGEPDNEELRQEILELRRDNGKLGKLLKESQQKLNDFSNERILWEQKKLSEMSTFNAYKESETQRLKRERAKLEKQTKLLAQLPSKKERNEIEELKAKVANLIAEHTKKDSLQNLTINRLRRTITDLTEQIAALQEEVRRYERFLHSELDANTDSRRKVTIPRVIAAEKLPIRPSKHDNDEPDHSLCKDNKAQVSFGRLH